MPWNWRGDEQATARGKSRAASSDTCCRFVDDDKLDFMAFTPSPFLN